MLHRSSGATAGQRYVAPAASSWVIAALVRDLEIPINTTKPLGRCGLSEVRVQVPNPGTVHLAYLATRLHALVLNWIA